MKKTNNDIVIHHNYLNESVFNLSEAELNLFIVIIYKMRFEESNTIIFNAKDIKNLTGVKHRGYERFERLIHNIQDKTIYLKTFNGYKRVKPFPTLDFNLKEKTIEIQINENIIPLFKELKEQFTKYSLKEFLILKSKYSKRLYQLLKQYEKIGKRTFDLDYLKKLLECNTQSYERMSNFETRVLKVAKEDINKNTSLSIDYQKLKSGKKIKSLEFIFFNKATESNKISEEKKETRKDIINRTLNTFSVKYIKDLTEKQKKILNATLKVSGYKPTV